MIAFAKPIAASKVPLHWFWHEGRTDSAYAIEESDRVRLTLQGYRDIGPIALVESLPVAGAHKLQCYYLGPPATNTFCAISRREQRTVRAMGYGESHAAGHVYRMKAPGCVPLYRVFKPGPNGDREHRLVADGTELVRLRKDGWTYDGTKGFVFPLR